MHCLQSAQTLSFSSSSCWPPAATPNSSSSLVPHFLGLCHWICHHPMGTVILTVVDQFSKMAYFVALNKLPLAKETAQLMLEHIFHLHGLPMDVVSDRGPQFSSAFWREFCSLIGAWSSLASEFHPQASRLNSTPRPLVRLKGRTKRWRQPSVAWFHRISHPGPGVSSGWNIRLIPLNWPLPVSVCLWVPNTNLPHLG